MAQRCMDIVVFCLSVRKTATLAALRLLCLPHAPFCYYMHFALSVLRFPNIFYHTTSIATYKHAPGHLPCCRQHPSPLTPLWDLQPPLSLPLHGCCASHGVCVNLLQEKPYPSLLPAPHTLHMGQPTVALDHAFCIVSFFLCMTF